MQNRLRHSGFGGIPTKLGGALGTGYPSILTDGTTSMRWVERDGYMCMDLTLTATGFAGTEGVDWENVESIVALWPTYWATRYPENIVLTIIDNTSIQLDWTNNGAQDFTEISIERSVDGVTYAEIDTVLPGVATFTDTSLTENYYYYRIRYNKAGNYSDYCTTVVNEWPLILYDGNTWNISDFTDESTMTKNASEQTSSVAVLFGANNPLAQAGADNIKPVWSSEGLTFDGVRQFIQAAAALNQPTWVYLCLKQLTWTDIDYIMDGVVLNSGAINQRTATPKIQMFSNTTYIFGETQFPVNTLGILRALFNGTYSKLQVNNLTPIVSEGGTLDMEGITLGRTATDLGGYYAHILAKGIVVRTIADNIYNSRDIYNKINSKYSVGATESFVTTGQFDNGKLVICFDDAKSTYYTAGYPIFTAQGIKTTTAVIGNVIGTAGYCTWAQLQEMAADGHDMQCHTHTHVNLALSTSAAVITQMNNNDAAFIANSLPAPQHLSYPYGYFSKTCIDALAGLRLSGRITTNGMADFVPIYKDTNKFQLSAIYIDGLDASGLTALNIWMNDAKAKKYAIIVFAHDVVAGGGGQSISTVMLNNLIDSAQSIGLDIITRSELYTEMTS